MKTIAILFSICFISGLCGLVYASDAERYFDNQNAYRAKFYGTVERIPQGIYGTWIVNGKEIFVNKDTLLKEEHGKADIGAYVEVKGIYSGKTFTAYKIEVKRDKNRARLYGIIESLPSGIVGVWVVNGKEILITKDTYIDEEHGKVAIGAYIEIKGSYSGKVFTAGKIYVKRATKFDSEYRK
ncbi:MAG: DUF5666 domain-containing protein [Nitrospiraceae bacterium]|nr:DUF5666 domain-containing protein [Nitrospiraceae bacterium]